MKLAYNCKFCGNPGTVDYEHPGQLTEPQVTNWLKYVACDSCAEFQRASRDATRQLLTLAGNWSNVIKYSPKQSNDIREETKSAIERVLRKLCNAIEKKTHWGGLFQPHYVDQIIERPTQAMSVVKTLFKPTT
jgi:hypothetical protein